MSPNFTEVYGRLWQGDLQWEHLSCNPLYPATEEETAGGCKSGCVVLAELTLDEIHRKFGARVNYLRVCVSLGSDTHLMHRRWKAEGCSSTL